MKLFPNFTSIPFCSPINIMGDELHSQSLVFFMFIKLIIGQELHPLKTLELKILAQVQNFQNFATKHQVEPFFMYSLVCLSFLKCLSMP